MSDDPVVIAKRWKMTLAEEGGIGDILNSLQERYLKRMGEVEPWETEKLAKLAVASRVAGLVRDEILAIIAHGSVQENHRAHIEKIERLPTAKRRWI